MNLTFELHNHGFEVHEHCCPPVLLAALQNEFQPDTPVEGDLLEESPTVRHAATGVIQQLATKILGEGCFPLHAVLHNRSETAQPWHQDTTVKPAEPGHDNSIYDQLLSVRISLDDCSFFDGALKLCPSSYKHGVLTPNEIRGHSLRPFSSPEMKAGDILLMHPLTIHASAASTSGKPCRVIEIVYAAAALKHLLQS